MRAFGAVLGSLAMSILTVTGGNAQSAPGADAWAQGPAAAGDPSQLAGVIDVPSTNAVLSTTTFQVGGWFVDRTAQGWSGTDDIELFLGTMDTGRFLAHAQIAEDRPDVGNALHNQFWSQSGFSASATLNALPAGPNTLSVYVHTPNKGWWFRQVSVTASPPRGAAPAPPLPMPTLGFDISYPQCPTGAEGPNPAFGIVGVNGGTAFSGNPCLPRQFAWALSSRSSTQPRVSLYMNTGNPGPTESSHWPAAGTSTPRSCDGSWSNDCAYDYGWLAAQEAFARGTAVAGSAAAGYVWWLDVEAVNSWSPDQSSNAADLSGALDYLHSVGVTQTGVYSTSTDWGTIIGSPAPNNAGPFAALLNWRPGPHNLQEAPDWCGRTVTGGHVKYVQFPMNGVDADYACPG
jgi:hypothetical protein